MVCWYFLSIDLFLTFLDVMSSIVSVVSSYDARSLYCFSGHRFSWPSKSCDTNVLNGVF